MRGTVLLALVTIVFADSCPEVSQLKQKEQSLKNQLQRQGLVLDQIRRRSEEPGTIKPVPPDPGKQHRDCSEVFLSGSRSSGSFWIRPDQSEVEVRVYCDMSGGGGWTVIQRRTDGSQRFNRSWGEYKRGFGDFESAAGEMWLGNDLLHQLTAQGNYSLRIRLQDFDGQQRYAEYRDFRVGHEQDQYRLSFGLYVGTAGDALSGMYQVGAGSWSSHQGANFSTYDRDNDNYEGNCAQEDQGGWWFNKCHCAHLNGLYFPGGHYSSWSDSGVVWFPWRGWWYSLKSTVMEIRPSAFKTPEADDPNAVQPGAGGGSVLL